MDVDLGMHADACNDEDEEKRMEGNGEGGF